MAKRVSGGGITRLLTPAAVARVSTRVAMAGVTVTALALALLPARLVVDAAGTVELAAGSEGGGDAAVSAPFHGTVLRVLKRSGSTVAAGEIVALMDSYAVASELSAALAEKQSLLAELAAAEERIQAARADAALDMVRAAQDRAVSGAEARQTEGAADPLLVEQLRQEERAAQAALRIAEARLEKMTRLAELGAISDRALAGAESDRDEADARHKSSAAAADRLAYPQPDTMAAPRRETARSAIIAEGAVQQASAARIRAAEVSADAADARVTIMESRIEQLNRDLDRAVLRAERGGVVGLGENVEDGAGITAGQLVFTVHSVGDVNITVKVPEWAYNAFAEGEAVSVRPTMARGVVIEGTVSFRGKLMVEEVLDFETVERFAGAAVSLTEPSPFPLLPGASITVEAVHARGPILWVAMQAMIAEPDARIAIGL